ncbi:MAG: protein kinase domain-containing protein [Gemmatimonadaceae bacterium]
MTATRVSAESGEAASAAATGSAPPNEPPAPARPRGSRALVWRLFLATAGVIALVLAGTLVLLSLLAQRTADDAVARGLDQTSQLVTALLDGRERSLESAALVFAQSPAFRAVILQKRPEDVLDQSTEAVQRTGATWVQITDEQGVRLARSDEPTAPPEQLAGSTLISGALDGDVMTGIGVAGDSALFQAVAVPIVGAVQVAGVLMAAQTIDSALAQSVKRSTASDVVFYVTDTAGVARVSASTLPRGASLDAFVQDYASILDASAVTSAAADSGRTDTPDTAAVASAELEQDGIHYVGQGQSLRSAGGSPLGGFIALRSRELEMAPFTALRRRILLAGALGVALALALSYVMARRITRPLLALAAATRRVAAGDYSVEVDVRSSDEIGTLADAMRSMVSDLHERQALAEALNVAHSAERAPDSAAERVARNLIETVSQQQDSALAPGKIFANRYQITDVLGVGGAGVVYKAHDTELGETIAIKTLRHDALVEERALDRLKTEIRLARRISHRNVVRIHDFGEADGVHFITMEFVAGTSLSVLLSRLGTLPVPATLAVAKQLCRALEVAHEQGIIHRDIKPQNLMVQPDGLAKVMDFGVARLAQRTGGLTLTGMVVGTPAYMAPEQLMDDDVDGRADLFAAGVVIYECLTGRRPFEADSTVALVGKLLNETPVSPHELNGSVPADLSAIILRTVSSDRNVRPRSATELHEMLARVPV